MHRWGSSRINRNPVEIPPSASSRLLNLRVPRSPVVYSCSAGDGGDPAEHMDALQAITDAVVCCDNDGTITSFNKAAERTFLWSASDAIGRNVSVLMPSPYREIHDNFLERFFETGTKKLIGVTRELKGLRADGDTFPLEISLGQITQAHGDDAQCPVDEADRCSYGTARGGCPVIHSEGVSMRGMSKGFVAVIRDVSSQVQKRMEATQRYKTDFEELAPIGKGGFGSVFKCKNKLDGQLYAVKKIFLQRLNGGFELEAMSVNASDSLTRLLEYNLSSEATAKLKEVQLLASITQHVNIVRYYYSWVEILPISEVDDEAVSFLEQQSQTPCIATPRSTTSSYDCSLSVSEGSFATSLSTVEIWLWDAIQQLRSSGGIASVMYVYEVLSGIVGNLRQHLNDTTALLAPESESTTYMEVAQSLWLETEQLADTLKEVAEQGESMTEEETARIVKACKNFSHELYLLHQQWPRDVAPGAREWPVAVVTHFLLFMTAVSNCTFRSGLVKHTESAGALDAPKDTVACRICEELISVEDFEKHCDTCIGKFKVPSRRDSTSLTGKRKTTIDDFTVLKKLAAGAFGRVFLVKKNNTGDIYALKVLKKHDTLQQDLLHRVKAERDILFGADCPFIVNLYYSFQSTANLYLVMEYLPGGDLGDMLENMSYLDEDHARAYAAEIIVALEYLHGQGIVHRDLKPDNVLIGKEGHLKLTDFGLSKRGLAAASHILQHPLQQGLGSSNDPDRLQHSAVGTPDYLAPEIILDQGHSFEVDWWALGCTIYEMLVGIPPFNDDEEMKIFQHIVECDYDLPPGECSPLATDLIERLLCLDPSTRLGANGAGEVKSHPFFEGVDWDRLNESPSDFFVPSLEDDTSCSYFSSATDVQPGASLESAPVAQQDSRKSMVATRKSRIQQLRSERAASEAEIEPKKTVINSLEGLEEAAAAIPEFSFVNLRALQQRTKLEAAGTPTKASTRTPSPGCTPPPLDLSFSQRNSVTFGPEESNGVATLYIQMQLHESRTLREVLDLPERKVSLETAMDIFVQIVVGLRHVHHRGIVHRDLKPTNIFLDEDNVVKIGDFGLATLYAHHGGAQTLGEGPAVLNMDTDLAIPDFAEDLTLGVGSVFYAAPEQLGLKKTSDGERNSASSGEDEGQAHGYSLKVDIFALGIILAELLLPTANSRNERYVTMMGLRKGQIPGAIFESFSSVVPWLQKMLSPDPEERPTTQQILDSALFAPYVSHGTAIALSSAMHSQGIDVSVPTIDSPCAQCAANAQLVIELANEVRQKDDRIAELLHQLRTLRSTTKNNTTTSD